MTRDKALMLLRRFGPLAVIVVLFAVVLASGLTEHLSLHELRARGAELQAFAAEKPLQCAAIYLALYVGPVAVSLPGALIMSLSAGFLFGPIAGGFAAVTARSPRQTACVERRAQRRAGAPSTATHETRPPTLR